MYKIKAPNDDPGCTFERLYFTTVSKSGSKTSENNELINLAINTNSQLSRRSKQHVTILAIYAAKQS